MSEPPLPGAKCPACKTILDDYSAVGGRKKIRAGDVSICVYCATVMEYTGKGFKRLRGKELEEVMRDPRVRMVQEAVKNARIVQ